MPGKAIEARSHASLAELPRDKWNALAAGSPFMRHEFLHALEATGCVGSSTGWEPCHASLWQDGDLVAAAPLYRKFHSWGEYVFDWAWADAFERAGGRYYPKLLCAVPFTPVSGPRLLCKNAELGARLLQTILQSVREARLSSFHCLFPATADTALLRERDLLIRRGYQYHWHNDSYRDFADFLGQLTHDKRKKIRQERRKVFDAGCRFVHKVGQDIGEADWAFFHRCYSRTYQMHRSTPYLSLDFFLRLGIEMPDNLLLIVAESQGKPIACALDLFDAGTLYGRYWGTLEYLPGLHFETSYYQGMEFCIERGLSVFEGGAQGDHKLARGFLPVATHSAHWLAHAGLAQAVEQFLRREDHAIEHYLDELDGPYRRDGSPADRPAE